MVHYPKKVQQAVARVNSESEPTLARLEHMFESRKTLRSATPEIQVSDPKLESAA